MNEIKTSQAKGMPLAPVGNENPTPTTQVAENGENREIDTGAALKDARPYSVIFAEELAAGRLDVCENPNQINKALQGIKGAASPCTYLVNERAHKFYRENGKWLARSEEWLTANPYTPGTRTAKAGGMLSDEEVASIKAQLAALELVPEAVRGSVAPIIAGLQGKLTAHEKAVSEAAISREKIRNRTAACTALEGILKLADKAGEQWEQNATESLMFLAKVLGLDQTAAAACLASLVGTDEARRKAEWVYTL